jgi:hypothetical protein
MTFALVRIIVMIIFMSARMNTNNFYAHVFVLFMTNDDHYCNPKYSYSSPDSIEWEIMINIIFMKQSYDFVVVVCSYSSTSSSSLFDTTSLIQIVMECLSVLLVCGFGDRSDHPIVVDIVIISIIISFCMPTTTMMRTKGKEICCG